LIHKQEHNS